MMTVVPHEGGRVRLNWWVFLRYLKRIELSSDFVLLCFGVPAKHSKTSTLIFVVAHFRQKYTCLENGLKNGVCL